MEVSVETVLSKPILPASFLQQASSRGVAMANATADCTPHLHIAPDLIWVVVRSMRMEFGSGHDFGLGRSCATDGYFWAMVTQSVILVYIWSGGARDVSRSSAIW